MVRCRGGGEDGGSRAAPGQGSRVGMQGAGEQLGRCYLPGVGTRGATAGPVGAGQKPGSRLNPRMLTSSGALPTVHLAAHPWGWGGGNTCREPCLKPSPRFLAWHSTRPRSNYPNLMEMEWFLNRGDTSLPSVRGQRRHNAVINQLGSGIGWAWVQLFDP